MTSRCSKTALRLAVPILLLALLLRAAWIAHFPANPIGTVDAEGYHLIARNLLQGNGFSMMWEAPFCPVAIRTPLYPLFLAGVYQLMGTDPRRAVLFQMLLETLTTALVLRAGNLLGGRRVGLLAGLLYAGNASTQRYTGVLFAETLHLTAMAAALCATLWTMQRPTLRWSALSGAMWALAILIKPNVQFLALGVGLLLLAPAWGGKRARRTRWARRARLRAAASFFIALGLVLLPWFIRNRVSLGRWSLSTAYEENLARVSAVATLAEVRGLDAAPWTATWETLYGEIVQEAARRYAWETIPEEAVPCAERQQRQRDVAAVAGRIVCTYPDAWLRSHLQGAGAALLDVGHRDWYRALTGKAWEQTGVLDNIWRRMGESLAIGAVGDALHALWLERVARAPLDAASLWWGLVLLRGMLWAGGLRGCWWLRHKWRAALLLGGIAAYGMLLAGPIAHDRLYLPAIPAVVILAAMGLYRRRTA